MKIAVILWTRPEIIKCSSIIRELQNQNKIERFVIHSNQHYSTNMDKVFFEDLELHNASYNLWINWWGHGYMTGKMLISIEEILHKESPDVVLVQWDTNTVIAGWLAASKIGIKVWHIEAGLRSYDRTMPEEINRIVVDQIADFCFCPTQKQADILIKENIDETKVFITGNTIVDAVLECIEIGKTKKEEVLNSLNIKDNEYILLTTHRPSNVDQKESLTELLEAMQEIKKISNKDILFPVHPRTLNNIKKFSLEWLLDWFKVIEPIWFIENLIIEKNSYMIATDSGWIQEEGCILKKKTLILRENTERPETLDVWGAILVGHNKDKLLSAYYELKDKYIKRYNPFGDGKAGRTILDILEK